MISMKMQKQKLSSSTDTIQILLQRSKLGVLEFTRHIRINIERRHNIRMTKRFLNYLDIHSRFALSCGKCMPQNMTAKIRQELIRRPSLRKYLIIIISDNSAQRFIERPLMLSIAKPIDEDKISRIRPVQHK